MASPILAETRRRFLAHFSGMGLGTTLLPGVLWSEMQQAGAQQVTPEMLKSALALAGLEFSEADRQAILEGVNTSVGRYAELRRFPIPDTVGPPVHFSPLVPGMTVDRTRRPFRASTPDVRRPARLEDVAYWPVTALGQLIRTRQVSSVELTEMYLGRIRRLNPILNCVVTATDELALAQARAADAETAAGRNRGPLHGIPWGCKDIIAAAGYRTTWGSDLYKERTIDLDASVVEMLRDAGAVLVAKLSTGEFAGGDRWFGGQARNPWKTDQVASGSSSGPGSATGGGLVAFSIGTETSGSILAPSARNGVTGLRPTLGRVSRYGAMVLSWTQDRLGPMCRSAEDCALVMSAISRPDGRDMSVQDLPFNWDHEDGVRGLRVGILREAFDEVTDPAQRRVNQQTIAQVEQLGIRLVDVPVPEFPTNLAGGDGVETAAFFDERIRSDQDKRFTRPDRGVGMRRARLVPAVEYMQGQRVRTMMMMELAAATAHVDVYLAPNLYNGAGGGALAATPDTPSAPAAPAQQNRGPVSGRHFTMANLATYPAVALPSGFNEDGTPLSVLFFARPFGETALLTLAKAYQDASGFHLRHPNL